jgi:hypothetical protein
MPKDGRTVIDGEDKTGAYFIFRKTEQRASKLIQDSHYIGDRQQYSALLVHP